MRQSVDHILTSHVGSLIRPEALLAHLRAKRSGGFDASAHASQLARSVAEVVEQQREAGVDVPSDGEFGKDISWSQYALERMSGFERRPIVATVGNPWARGADRTRFAEFYAEMDAREPPATQVDSVCVGPIRYTGEAALQADIRNFKAALAASGYAEGFLPVAAVSSAIPDRKNEFYARDEDCMLALAEALRTEYRTITDAGLVVQLDDARAAVTFDRMVPPASFADYRLWLARQVEIINHSLEGIPESQVRYHVCWGSWPGPHVTDVAMRDIVDLVLKVKAGAYCIEMANPRHEHEWRVWESVKLPEGKVLIPGVVSHVSNVVEHPELVAERIVRLAQLVGRENVIAGTDCGFAQSPFYRRVHPSVMWAKLESLAAGAALATKMLWARQG